MPISAEMVVAVKSSHGKAAKPPVRLEMKVYEGAAKAKLGKDVFCALVYEGGRYGRRSWALSAEDAIALGAWLVTEAKAILEERGVAVELEV